MRSQGCVHHDELVTSLYYLDNEGSLNALARRNGIIRFVFLKELNGNVVNELQSRNFVNMVNKVFIRLIG